MACGEECFLIVTKWESYALEKPFYATTLAPAVVDDCSLSEQEAADRVAEAVKNHNKNDSVELPHCPRGCKCVPYETPGPPVELKSRPELQSVIWFDRPCFYTVLFTVSVKETKIPIGLCRPESDVVRPTGWREIKEGD